MKHLRAFNESTHPMEKMIDWKTVNYVVDKLTKFEDSNLRSIIAIHSYKAGDEMIGSNFDLIAIVYGTQHNRNHYLTNQFEDIFTENRFVYRINFCGEEGHWVDMKEYEDEICKLLSPVKLVLKYTDTNGLYFHKED